MELRLKYGLGMVHAEFPDPPLKNMNGKSERPQGSGRRGRLHQFTELHPKHIATLQKPADIVSQALEKPLGCHPFNQVFRGARNVLLVVPDPEEFDGAEYYLPVLLERLQRLHVPAEEITILVAKNSEQSSPTSRKYDFVGMDDRVRVCWHDPQDHKMLEYVGLTRRGTPVFINRLILDADYVMLCGTVTHHPFAGYGGGPRLLVPGCAGQETIYRHHALAIDPEAPRLHPRCRDAVVEGNPLQEDAREAFRFVTTNFLVHTVLNDQQQVIGAVTGEPLQAFAAGCRTIDDMFHVPVSPPANLVVVSCGGFPADRDYRSAHVALQRAGRVAGPGGVIIFLAECRDGLGSHALTNWLQEKVAEVNTEVQGSGYSDKLEWRSWHHELRQPNVAEVLIALAARQKAQETHVIAVTALEPALLRKLGFTPAGSFREALALAESWLPDIFSAIVISNGNLLVPYLC
ncbi:MAG: nickel-dependent lactate racemase [candidate division KSB1 bacterium]|nr:nickel-dependent lactate racemase [candidate division KSB1 bacterium]MDZ7302145.1 nickel-dependent lactate racemase [candidate division KSB1 bacterium]MDZ7311255.1 nickel-dependent lactate racemase [candidate division KSB1 bacterium]